MKSIGPRISDRHYDMLKDLVEFFEGQRPAIERAIEETHTKYIKKEKQMNASQMANLIEADERLAGLDINVNMYRNTVEAYGFNATKDWKETKAILEEKGFSCGPNFGQWEGETEPRPSLRERYENMTAEEKARADETWKKMGGAI